MRQADVRLQIVVLEFARPCELQLQLLFVGYPVIVAVVSALAVDRLTGGKVSRPDAAAPAEGLLNFHLRVSRIALRLQIGESIRQPDPPGSVAVGRQRA